MSRPLQRILFVEDDFDIQTIARLSLEKVGRFEIEVCGSGQEALGRAPRFQPDLILLDVMMPILDGPATLLELRKMPECAHIPVVFVTARAQAHDIARYKELGAAAVINKPFDPMKLPDQVREIWASL